MQETWVQYLDWEDPLEKEMATHSSIVAWEIPWTEKPGGLQSMGLQSRTLLSTRVLFLLLCILHFWKSQNRFKLREYLYLTDEI